MVWHLRSSRYMRAVAAARARTHTHTRTHAREHTPAMCQRYSKTLDAHRNASDHRNVSDPDQCTRPQR